VFCPYLQSVRDSLGAEREKAVLLMDSCKSHCPERVLRFLGENRVLAIVFLFHVINLFQVLDLSCFGVLKHRKAAAEGRFDEESVNNQIAKLLQAHEQTTISFNIRGSFRRAGLYLNTASKSFKIGFIEEAVQVNPGFDELLERNLLFADMFKRCQSQVFEMINSQFIPDE
jgi:hypothetical protein